MNKAIVLVDIATPFYVDYKDRFNSKYNDEAYLYFVAIRESDPDRKTWGKSKNSFIIAKNFGLIKLLNSIKPTVVFITQYNRWESILVQIYCVYHKIPFYIGPHEIFNNTTQLTLRLILKCLYYKVFSIKSKGSITMGKFSVKFYRLLTKKKTFSIPYSIDLTRFTDSSKIIDDEIVFFFCGRLIEFRNPLLVINVFHKVLSIVGGERRVKLHISGQGPLENQCKELIKNLGLDNCVEWIGNIESWNDIPKLYRNIDVLMALQDYSGWGMIIPEAMASGKAIISTDRMEASDSLIINGYNGYLVDINDQDSIITPMLNYIRNPREIVKHGSRSVEMVKSVAIDQTIDILAGLITDSQKR